VPIDAVLQPCCSTFRGLMEGGVISDGYAPDAAGAPQLAAFLQHAGRVLGVVRGRTL
jgi:hypothetical protein